MFRDIFATDPNELLVGLLALSVICGAFAQNIGERKGRSTHGLVLGLALGPIGILIAAELRPAGQLRATPHDQAPVAVSPQASSTPPPFNPASFDPASFPVLEGSTV